MTMTSLNSLSNLFLILAVKLEMNCKKINPGLLIERQKDRKSINNKIKEKIFFIYINYIFLHIINDLYNKDKFKIKVIL